MKKKGIILSIIGIFIVSVILVIIIKNNTKEYIMYDGTMLAITIDGSPSASFPTDTNKYHVEIECDGGVGEYLPDDDYNMKFTIKDIIKDGVKCNIDFTTIKSSNKNSYLLKTKVESFTTNYGDFTITTDNSTFTPNATLSRSEYIIANMETTSDSNDAFVWDDTAKTWTSQNHTASTTSNGGVGMSFTVPDGYYQLCYTMGSEKNWDYGTIYIDGVEKFNTSGKSATENCEYIGQITSSNIIRVAYRKDGSGDVSPDNIVFYMQSGTYNEDITSETKTIGYRYSGRQPNNWVWFNNELWRIIGSVPTTLSDKTVENRVKIIRAESIGGLAYHSSDSNTTWGNNTLYDLLNNYYYGKKDATGSSPCYGYSSSSNALCNYKSKGISSESNDYYGKMIIDVYMNAGTISELMEEISTYYAAETSTLTSRTAKIGLMTASDYGYASSEITYSTYEGYDYYEYIKNNWLYGQGLEWTMTPLSTSSVVHPEYDGRFSASDATYGYAVRPVVYLDSSVYIISGEGTENNPYILGM